MELIQLGAMWCRPCIAAKDYILRTYDVNTFKYTFINLDEPDGMDIRYVNIINKVQPKSIPSFICVEGEEVILEFKGFDKHMIDKCISYMITEQLDLKAIKIEDTITTEVFQKMQIMNDEILNKHKDFLEDLNGEFDDSDYDDE
jgi:hypothetical protein